MLAGRAARAGTWRTWHRHVGIRWPAPVRREQNPQVHGAGVQGTGSRAEQGGGEPGREVHPLIADNRRAADPFFWPQHAPATARAQRPAALPSAAARNSAAQRGVHAYHVPRHVESGRTSKPRGEVDTLRRQSADVGVSWLDGEEPADADRARPS